MRGNDDSYLRRLPDSAYQGEAYVHWTMTMANRRGGWLDARFHALFRELLCHTNGRYRLSAPAYCLMPDHLHLLLIGLAEESDQRPAIQFLRRHLNRVLPPGIRLQHQPHDHVLREWERESGAFAAVSAYVLENPLRAGLLSTEGSAADWPYSGCLIAGYPDLDPFRPNFWDEFWKLHHLAAGRRF